MPEPSEMGKCIGCRMCEKICPDMCINVDPEGGTENEE
jgi:formate hydrogenlyase subunit 6/NADH:ubiquinone oxidoreductase subunit I